MSFLSRRKNEAATIRRIFKGDSGAYRFLIEQYQPMAYAVALAHTGSVYLADKAVTAAFEDAFGRLVSLSDPKRLGTMLCALVQHEADQLAKHRVPDWNRPRKRCEPISVDLNWAQTELIEPLVEELGSFTTQERSGLLLYAFCRCNARQIADLLKIEKKEAAEDLARTRENVEAALLKEVVNALSIEADSRERLLRILDTVAGPEVARVAGQKTRIGRRKRKVAPLLVTLTTLVVLGISGFFGYRAFFANDDTVGVQRPGGQTAGTEGDATSLLDQTPAASTGNHVISGRVVDHRFGEDGVAGVTVASGDKVTETDSYGAFELRGMSRGQHEVEVRVGDVVLRSGVRLSTEERNPPMEIPVTEDVPARFLFHGRVTDRNTGQILTTFEVASCKEHHQMVQPYLLGRFRECSHPEGLLTDRFLTPGEYSMYVRAHGYAPLPYLFIIDEHWDNNKVHEFGLYRATTLEGTVYGSNELSLSDVSIVPRQGSAYGLRHRVSYGNTNSMGRFTLYELPVGIQSFLFHHMQYGTARAIVELEPGKTTNIRVQLPRRGALTGDITLGGAPATFSEFRRRAGGSGVDLTKNVNYISPGQYEINLTPEPVTIWASVAPRDGDRWFERRFERSTKLAMNEPTWLDFNFESGPGVLHGNISAHGAVPRSVFVEVVYRLGQTADQERIYYNLGSSSSFRIDQLPLGSGEVSVYASPRALDSEEFASARVLMSRQSREFTLTVTGPSQHLDFRL